MKKLALLTLTTLFALVFAESQAQVKQEKEHVQETKKAFKTERVALRKLEGGVVSSKSMDQFDTDFGKVQNVVWKRSANFDEVTFTKDERKLTAFYDSDSKLVGTTEAKTFADVPANGQKEIKTKFREYSVGQVVLFDDNEANDTDMVLYGSQFDDADKYFVELTKGASKIVVEVSTNGAVSFFKKLS